ncbi:MAG: hypothetical protein JOZ63_13670, partial [Planctomycetaceae bacterium]|nr:hypothetical protein [Planctomycetaceae bacterium]
AASAPFGVFAFGVVSAVTVEAAFEAEAFFAALAAPFVWEAVAPFALVVAFFFTAIDSKPS